MNKSIVLASAAAAATAVTAAAYYQSPAKTAANDVPPALVAMSATEASAELRKASFHGFMSAYGLMSGDMDQVFEARVVREPNGSLRINLIVAGDHILLATAAVRSVSPTSTEIDVNVDMKKSAFATNPTLQPYDVKAMATLLDLLLTEYLESLATGRRIASWTEIGPELTRQIGFDDAQATDFAKRVDDAFRSAYASYFANPAEVGTTEERPASWQEDEPPAIMVSEAARDAKIAAWRARQAAGYDPAEYESDDE